MKRVKIYRGYKEADFLGKQIILLGSVISLTQGPGRGGSETRQYPWGY